MTNPKTRRQFLSQSAALAGVAPFLGAQPSEQAFRPLQTMAGRARTALGADDTIRMAVIGTGGMGRSHCGSIMRLAEQGHEKVQIVAVSDVSTINMEAARSSCADRQGIEVAAEADYRKILERDDIHGVLIASPEHWHAQMSADAIVSGKDVYCEKPATLRLGEALALREVVNAHEQVFQIGTQFVSIPMWSTVRDLIAEGKIGKPICSQTSYCRNSRNGEWLYNIDERVIPGETIDWNAWTGELGPMDWNTSVFHRWRRYSKWSTGIIGDLLVHKMTPLMMALDAGWPTRVSATGGHYVDKSMDNHDHVNLTVEFEREHTMLVMGSTCNETGFTEKIRGHEANMNIGSNRLQITPERIFADELEPETVNCEALPMDSQDHHRLNWWKYMRSREKPLADIELATQVMVAVDLATRSLWEGGTFSFDPDTHLVKHL